LDTLYTMNTDLVTGRYIDLPQRIPSTPASITAALREAIFSGEYQSGEPLRQEAVAKKYAVSRIPIRESFQQLEREGLLSIDPNRGAFVTPVEPREVEEISELRFLLEPHMLARAIPQMSNASLGLAEDVLAEADRETDQGKLAMLNWMFHRALFVSADQPYTLTLLESVHLKTERYMRLVLNLMQHQEQSQREHRAILEACRARELARATELLQDHIKRAGLSLARFLREHLQSTARAQRTA
jgi:DNA-binding GntR family transcriptional regulator